MQARLLILGAALLFSTGGLAIKATSLDAWQVAGLRSGIACVILALAFPASLRRIRRDTWLVASAYAATLLLFTLANKNTTAGNAIFIQNAAPLWILLLSRPLLGESVGRRELGTAAGMGVGVLCLFLATRGFQVTAPDPVLGNSFALGASLCWGLTLIGLRRLASGGETGSDLALAATLVGNGMLFLFCLPVMDLPFSATAADWLWVIYLGAIQIALAYVLLTRGAARVPAFELSLLLLLEAVLNPLWTFLLLGEAMGGLALVGGAIILALLVVDAAGRRTSN
ncbi:MAG: DMT family transporter [Myxococcota bacterium]|nr:DMT family transporter [Myxococcota bacterium]